MKKKTIIISLIVIGFIVGGIFILKNYKKDNGPSFTITNDSLNFKNEHEALNGKKNASNKEYYEMNIKSYNPMFYSSYEEVMKTLNEGTGVIYLGFPECPWCRNLLPTLVDSAIEYGVKSIQYLNIVNDRNTLTLNKKGKVVTEKEGTKEYDTLVTRLSDHLRAYAGLIDETIKRIYLPTIVFVKDGEVVGIQESLSSYSKRVDGDTYGNPMNFEEKAELKGIFISYYEKLYKK